MLNSTDYLNKQGAQILENKNIYNTNFGFSGLQLSSMEGVQTIIENMESMNRNAQVQSIKSPALDKYEQEFQNTLVEYNKAYQELSNDRLQKIQTLQKTKQYLGKAITNEDGNYYYVNDYGFTHKYSIDAWNQNNKSCPQEAIGASNSLFREGPNMNPGQPCHLAGKNIMNETTKEAAWVDIKGYKHVYSDDVWNEKSKTCSSKTLSISDDNYKLIPEGSPMTTTTICDTLDINPNAWIRIQKINKRLIELAKKMSKEIEKMHIKDEVMRKMLEEQKNKIDIYVVHLNDDRRKLNYEKKSLETASGQEEDSSLEMTANLYQYILLFVFALISIFITIKIIGSPNISNKILIVVFIFVIVSIYYIYQNMGAIM